MSRKASINIQKAHEGEFFHNTREKPTKNSIFNKEANEYDRSALEAIKLYREDLQKKAQKYTERTGQKLQKKAITLMNALINLDERHSLNDVKKVAKLLEEKLGVKVYQVALHRDEGYVDEQGQKHINYHAHILFSGLDEEGRAVKRNKLNIHLLRELQTEVAEILGMERGTRGKKKKHVDIYTYKKIKEQEAEAIDKLKKNLKLDNKKIQKYTKLFAKALDKYTNMFNNIKKEDVLNLFVKFLKQFKQKIELLEEENTKLKTIASKKNFENAELKAELAKLKEENAKLLKENLRARKTIKEVKQLDAVKLAEENRKLKLTVKNLQAEISALRKHMIEINKKLEKKGQENLFTQEDYKYLSKIKKELRKNTIEEVYTELIKFKQQINKKAQARDLEL